MQEICRRSTARLDDPIVGLIGILLLIWTYMDEEIR